MKLGFSQQEVITTAKSLGLPTDGFVQRRVARAYDLVESNKVSQIDDGIFRVRSQYDAGKSYIVNVNSGEPSCDCPDGERTINCKHRIASLLYAGKFEGEGVVSTHRTLATPAERKQSQAITCVKTTDGNESDFWRRSWLIAQGNKRTVVYEEHDGRLFCNCGAYYQDCEHKQLVIKMVTKELKAIKADRSALSSQAKPTSDCGTDRAKQLQDKFNGQLDSLTGVSKTQMTIGNNGNGAKAPSLTGGFSTQITTPTKLDLRDPFQQSEQLDIDQIEGHKNGELTWKLRNGEVVISYKGIMTLAEKHKVTFSEAIDTTTNTVIAKGRCGTSKDVGLSPTITTRVSGKPINGNEVTAIELAKRNAARQLLPLNEIKAIEKKE